MSYIILADNMDFLPTLASQTIDLIYIDPPFNTGHAQHSARDSSVSYDDSFDDFTLFIKPRLEHAKRVLKPAGSLFFHIDYREAHYCKVLLDSVFGRPSFMNEIIWAYDYGGRPKNRWPCKHDTIFWYAADPNNYTFNYDAIDRIPYMAPGLVGPEKAAKGKTPTDVWWHTIVPTQGKERTGYPTQKPLGIIQRIVDVHTNAGDLVLDFFAGSGTLGVAAAKSKRDYVLVDNNPDAVKTMVERLAFASPAVLTMEGEEN